MGGREAELHVYHHLPAHGGLALLWNTSSSATLKLSCNLFLKPNPLSDFLVSISCSSSAMLLSQNQGSCLGCLLFAEAVSACLTLINSGHLQGFSAHLVLSYCLSDRSVDFLVISLALPTVSSSLVQTRTCSKFPNVSPLITACLKSLSPSSEGDCEVMGT